MIRNKPGKTIIRGISSLLLIIVILSTHLRIEAATRYEMPTGGETTVTEPPVILQSGTAGSSTVYANGTSASVTVDSLATTFHPNGYNIVTGSFNSGSLPSSVSAVDSEYFTVDGSGTDTSSTSYHPTAYNLAGGTNYVSGSVDNLTDNDNIYMVFESYLSTEVNIEDTADGDTSDVDSSPDKGSSSNFTAQRSGPDGQFDELTEEYFGGIIEDFVDLDTSDVDSSPDKGTHSNFVNQKTGPDLQVDVLTEENITGNYQLDLEVQWRGIAYFLQGAYLCIYAATFTGSESLNVDYWDTNGSQWVNLGVLTAGSWTNISVAAYLASSTFTVRFKGAEETSDLTQDTWEIDASLIRLLGSGSSEDPVDNDASDVDSSSDKGTHSNFADQQSGPDASYDTLTEANTVSNWWDTGYIMRRQLNVTTSPTLPAGYSVSLTIDTTGADFQDDGEDLRIVYWNGTGYEELDRINTTSFNSASTELWFATVNQISSGGYDDNYYIYYSNPSASSPPANRSRVYLWWDDFSTNTLSKYDLAKWVDIHGADTYYSTPTYDAANERVSFDTGDNYASDMYPKGVDVADALISVKFWADLNYPTEATVALISRLNNPGTSSTHYYFHYSHGSYTSPGGSYNSWTNGERNTLMYSPPSNIYWNFNQVHNLTYVAYGTSHKLWYDEKMDDSPLASATHTGDTSSGRWGWAPAQVRGWVDDILIRRYVDPEPTVSVGAAESLNYEVDLEIQWTNVTYILPNEELCIYTGSAGAEDIRVEIWNTGSSSWDTLLNDLSPNAWNNVSIANWLTDDTITVRFKGSNETGDTIRDQWQIDVALIHVWSTDPARYSLDLEVQWTNVSFSEVNEVLCIYGGTMGSEDIRVDVWYNNAWNNLFTDLSTGWNNISVSSYLTSSNFTIRFKGGSETSDAVQDTWQIDVSLLHVWTIEYTAEVEFSGNSNLYDWTQLSWTVDSSWTIDAVQVTLQLYNYTGQAYPDGGDGYISYTSGAADTDETRNQTITANPENFRNGTGGWKIKVKGMSYAEIQFNLKVDLVEAATTYYSEYTASTEFLFDDVTDNQSPSLNFTVVCHNSVDGASVTIQVWNYTTSSYATSGQGYLSYTSTGGNVTSHLNITDNADSCLNGTNARIRITAVHSTTSSFQQHVNYLRLIQEEKQSNYDYVLNVSNQVVDAWNVRLRAYGQTNIGRLLNLTISFKNESQQIIILNGAYSQDVGSWTSLPGSGNINIVVDVSAESKGTSLIWIYLEVLKPGTKTYSRNEIFFRID